MPGGGKAGEDEELQSVKFGEWRTKRQCKNAFLQHEAQI